jgi:hypothetical protein
LNAVRSSWEHHFGINSGCITTTVSGSSSERCTSLNCDLRNTSIRLATGSADQLPVFVCMKAAGSARMATALPSTCGLIAAQSGSISRAFTAPAVSVA